MLPLQNRSRYPYNETGELGLAPETPLFDPLITLAALAMKTTTIRLGTGVNIVAQTNPLLLAKQLATLDVLCGGRLIFGAGIDVVEHESAFLSWHGFKSFPLPVQKPGIPIVMGGNAGKIFQRIAKYGDGWFIPPCSPDKLRELLADLRVACGAEGRDYNEIELTTLWSPSEGAESLKVLADLGVARVVIMNAGIDALKAVAEAHIR